MRIRLLLRGPGHNHRLGERLFARLVELLLRIAYLKTVSAHLVGRATPYGKSHNSHELCKAQ